MKQEHVNRSKNVLAFKKPAFYLAVSTIVLMVILGFSLLG